MCISFPLLYTGQWCIYTVRLSIKKSLFPVQRVAKIEASQAAAIFFSTFFFVGREILSIFRKK